MRFLAFFVMLALICGSVGAMNITQHMSDVLENVTNTTEVDSFIVFVNDSKRIIVDEEVVEALVQSINTSVNESEEEFGTVSVEEVLEPIEAEPAEIVKIIPNSYLYTAEVLNDPFIGDQYHLNITDTFDAWDALLGSQNITIAVIDTGADYTHPDLVANLWNNTAETSGTPGVDDDANGYIDDFYGWNTAWNNNSIEDTNGHGTHVAGTIAGVGNNSLGISGVCPNCSIMVLRAGVSVFTISTILDAVEYAIANDADIISMSLGSLTAGCSGFTSTFQNATDSGILLVAAAGNDNTNSYFYPAVCDEVISVASTDSSDQRSSFSNYGSWVDIAAPGSNILATHVPGISVGSGCTDASYSPSGDGYGYCSGTSMAAPVVSGALGLYLSLYGNVLNHTTAVNLMNSTGDDPDSAQYIGQRLNVSTFLNLNSISETQASCSVPLTGNWSITSSTVCENVSIFVNGDIIILENTTMNNVTLDLSGNFVINGSSNHSFVNVTINATQYFDGSSQTDYQDNLGGSDLYLYNGSEYVLDGSVLGNVFCLECNASLSLTQFSNFSVEGGNISLYDSNFDWLMVNTTNITSNVSLDGLIFNGSLSVLTYLEGVWSNVNITSQLFVGQNTSVNLTQSNVSVNISAYNNSMLQLYDSVFDFDQLATFDAASVGYDVPFATVITPQEAVIYNASTLILQYVLNFSKEITYFNFTQEDTFIEYNDTIGDYYFDGENYTANISQEYYGNLSLNLSFVDTNGVSNTSDVMYVLNFSIPGATSADIDGDGVNDTNDSIIGNASFITTTFSNVSIFINNSQNTSRQLESNFTIVLKRDNQSLVEFVFNFSNATLNVSNFILRNRSVDNKSQMLFKGVNLSENNTKTLYLDVSNDTRYASICIKDEEVSAFSEYSNNCTGYSEYYISSIPFSNSSYIVNYTNSSNTTVQISGLRNSLVSQECTESWTTTSWTTCSSSIQYRNATDANACGTEFEKPAESQSCTVVSGSSGGGGGGGGSSGGGGGGGSSAGVAYIPLPVADGQVSSITYRRYYNVTYNKVSANLIFYKYSNGSAVRLIDYNNTFVWLEGGNVFLEQYDWNISLFTIGETSAEIRIQEPPVYAPEEFNDPDEVLLYPTEVEEENVSESQEVTDEVVQEENDIDVNETDSTQPNVLIQNKELIGVSLAFAVITLALIGILVFFVLRRIKDSKI